MTKEVQTTITCDSCKNDLSPKASGYPHEYILRLTVEDVALFNGGAVYAMMIHPPIGNDLYFCNLKCMKNFNIG